MKKKKSKIIPLPIRKENDQIINDITTQNLHKISQDLGELKDMIDNHYKKNYIDKTEEE